MDPTIKVDCNGTTVGVQADCTYATGATFKVQVHATLIPAGGYSGYDADLSWTKPPLEFVIGTIVQQDASAPYSAWPDCAYNGSFPPDVDVVDALSLGCAATLASTHTGALFELQLKCTADGDVQLALAEGLGKTDFVIDVANSVAAAVVPASVHCVSPPNTTIDSGPSGLINSTSASFSFSATPSAGATFECNLDGAGWSSCSSPKNYPGPLSQGAHTFQVRAVNGGGADASPASRSFTIDSIAPQTTIDSGPSSGGTTNDNTPTFGFSSEPGATFECQVDASGFAPCSSTYTTPPLTPDGLHSFQVRAKDPAGNTDATPAIRSFTVDTSSPDTTIDSGPSGPIKSTSATFSFSANPSAGASFECNLDASGWSSCSSPKVYNGLLQGGHDFQVRAKDAANNTDPDPAARSFTVDTIAPDTTIDSGPSGVTNNTTPAFGFSSNEPGSNFECQVDGGGFAPCASPHTTAALGDGSHSFQVRATDAVGNTDPSAATRSFTVDTSPPLQPAPPGAPPPPVQSKTNKIGACASLAGTKLKRCLALQKCKKLKGKKKAKCLKRARAIGKKRSSSA